MADRIRTAARYALVIAFITLSACSDPNEPAPTQGAPAIACPANITTRGVSGAGQPMTYPAPTVTGGAPPVTVTCTPASGSSFNVGTTAVACSAVDAAAQRGQCSFTVTLTPLVLAVTKFVAFGDSFTEGENGRLAIGWGFIDPTETYPVKLQALLNAEYPGQSITVPNYGKSGDRVEDGLVKLPGVLATEHPGALLLLMGYNNLLLPCAPGLSNSPDCAQKISDVTFGIRDLIRIGKRPEYGVRYIFVSTLTPPGQFLGGSHDRRIANDAIVRTNTGITAMVRSEGVTLVDTYPRFIGHELEYIDQDGLHLQPAGYQALADSFFSVIKTTVTSTPGLGVRSN